MRMRIMVAGLLFVGSGVTAGQDFPAKPIRIVTSGVGGSGDFTARWVAQGLAGPLGQSVIVDNRPSGVIPGQVVSQAPPDGYTLLVASTSFLIGQLFSKIPYDPVKDFSPITVTDLTPSPVVVHPSLPVKSIKELIALAKAKPGELNYGATAKGSANQLAAELFNSMAGINTVGIIYSRGAAAAVTGLISGETQIQFGASAVLIKSGKIRALAVTSKQPSALFPGLPTVAASGLPGYEAVGLTAIFAPARTPEAVVRRLNQEIVRVLSTADAKEKFFNSGLEIANCTPEQLAAIAKAEIEKWDKVVKTAGIKLE